MADHNRCGGGRGGGRENDTTLIKSMILSALIVLLVFLGSFMFQVWNASAAPEGPYNLTVMNSTRRIEGPATQTEASAGNVSQLNIYGTATTKTWAGFYGNITGTIMLDDASNNTMYQWSLAEPEGEIYASNDTIDFSHGNIECYNFTRTGDGYFDLASLEASLGLEDDDMDGVNETFTLGTSYGGFFAGTNQISGLCPEVALFNSTGESSAGEFMQVLLYEKSKNNIIYTGIIEDRFKAGFDSRMWNFQMLVGVNGHDGNTDPQVYYFYVELE